MSWVLRACGVVINLENVGSSRRTYIIALRSRGSSNAAISRFPAPCSTRGSLNSMISSVTVASLLFDSAGSICAASYRRLHVSRSSSQCRPSVHPIFPCSSTSYGICIASPMFFQNIPMAQRSRSLMCRHSYLFVQRMGSRQKRLSVYSISSSEILPALRYLSCR